MKKLLLTATVAALALVQTALAQPTDPNWPRRQWHEDMRYERSQGFTRDGWNGSGTKLPHQFNIVGAPYPVRYGTHSERFEIRPTDDNAMRDLGITGGNRSELTQRPSRDNLKIGEDAWFGWSFYHENLPSGLAHDQGWNPKLGQWKTDLDAPPIIEFSPVYDGRTEGTHIGINLNDLEVSRGREWSRANRFGYVCTLFSIRQSRNRWTDIVVNTNFADNENGYLRVWINGRLQCDYRGPIVVTPVDRFRSYGVRNQGPLFKRGYWSGHLGPDRWRSNYPSRTIPTFVVYYDEWRQGRSREEVDIRMIQAAGGAPVD
jgi:opacity protein-like surface antigen